MQVARALRDLFNAGQGPHSNSEEEVHTVGEADADLENGHEGCYIESTTFGRTLVLSSNLPFGVSIMTAGGRKGYSEGSSMRKWYSPPSNSVPGGPRMVQCHSCAMSVG